MNRPLQFHDPKSARAIVSMLAAGMAIPDEGIADALVPEALAEPFALNGGCGGACGMGGSGVAQRGIGGPLCRDMAPECPPGHCVPGRMGDARTGGVNPADIATVTARAIGDRPTPYVDPMVDWLNMDVLYSEETTLAPGTLTNVTIAPQQAMFFAFYYSLIVYDPTTRVQQVAYTYRRPRVVDCAAPCGGVLDRDINGYYGTRVPQSPAGTPMRAILVESYKDSPLVVPATNRQSSGNLTAQLEVRGYCCSTLYC